MDKEAGVKARQKLQLSKMELGMQLIITEWIIQTCSSSRGVDKLSRDNCKIQHINLM